MSQNSHPSPELSLICSCSAFQVVDRNFIATDSGKLCSSMRESHPLSSEVCCSDKERNRRPARPFASHQQTSLSTDNWLVCPGIVNWTFTLAPDFIDADVTIATPPWL